jgi:hypothetical protein
VCATSGRASRTRLGPILGDVLRKIKEEVDWTSAPSLNEWLKMVSFLDIEVEGELVRMRSQPDRIDFVFTLVTDVGFQQVLGKDVPL